MTGRTVMHLDMDAYFASVEQQCNPALRGKPIAVIGSGARTVVTTASYEARKSGVKTGMTVFEVRRLCPEIIFVEETTPSTPIPALNLYDCIASLRRWLRSFLLTRHSLMLPDRLRSLVQLA